MCRTVSTASCSLARAVSVCLIALAQVFGASQATAQCDAWMSPLLADTEIGANAPILAAVSYNSPQGNGTPWIVVAGSFTRIGGRDISYIAAWDGSTWREIGETHALSSMNFIVNSLAVYNGRLIAAGEFTRAGNTAVNNIAQWNGFTWEAMGTGLTSSAANLHDHASALQVFNNELVVGGHFNRAGGQPANRIAKWNGSAWSPLGTGVSLTEFDDNTAVFALTVYNNQLVAGGYFNTAGGNPALYVARWNGSTWSPIGGGAIISAGVLALCVSGSDLYAGGQFSSINPSIQRWNGSSWSGLGSGVDGAVYALAPHLGGVLVGGSFGFAGGVQANQIALWTAGGTWSAFPPGVNANGEVLSLSVAGGPIIMGGAFTQTASGTTLNRIAIVNGSSFFPFQESPPAVSAMTTYNGKVYTAGSFVQPGGTNTPDIRNVAVWDGLSIRGLGTGTNGTVTALKGFNSGTIPLQNKNIVAGGTFTVAGSVTVSNIAMWTEEANLFPPPAWRALGAGLNGNVAAIERFNNFTYAAGSFTMSGATPVSRIARFDGTNWVALGTGLNGTANALKVYNGQLYAGGLFTTAGGLSSGGLARWNGTVWSTVGGAFGGTVHALEVFNNELVIGGAYPGIGGNPNIARYNGSVYSTLGTGGTNDAVRSLTVNGTKLYIGGDFTLAGGVSAARIARWSSSSGWEAVRTGSSNSVRALASIQNEVHAGANYNGVSRLPVWKRYTTNGIPWIVQQPFLAQGCYHGTQTAEVVPAQGYSISSVQWRHDGTLVAAGATGTGSFISFPSTYQIRIANMYLADAGLYICDLTNSCGSVASSPATLSVCIGNFNCDGAVDFFDYLDFVGAFAAQLPSADFNQDGVIDFFDYLDFVQAFTDGC